MRVLFFRMLCDTGGVSTWMLEHARELERRGVECDFWFLQKSSRLAEFEATGHATLGPISALAAMLETGRYDVVHVDSGGLLAELVAHIAPPRTTIVASIHGSLARMFDRHNCTALVAVSQGMADLNQPLTDLCIDVIPNGVDLSRFSEDGPSHEGSGGPILAFVGRTTAPVKDFPRFTRIAQQLVERGFRAWVADAHGADWEKLADRGCAAIPIERWSRWSHDEMPEFYRSVARSGGALIMTSWHEGLPYAPMEAAACGAPTFGPDVVGVREAIVSGATGLLFPTKATDEEAATLLFDFLNARGDAHAWQSRCVALAHQNFSASRMTDRYLEVYRRAAPRVTSGADLQARASRSGMTDEEVALREWWKRQQRLRGRFLLLAATDLVRAGYPDHALFSLTTALRVSPRYFLSRRTAFPALGVMARTALRARVLMKRLRRARSTQKW